MASRRTTLGPMSNSALNSRASIGMGPKFNQGSALKSRRASAAPAPLVNPGRRSSTTTNGSVRRSSAAIGRGSTQMPEPRPLSDKTFMASSVRNLICYLSEHGFDHAISPKLLSNPTSKDFQHILLFLLRQLDPMFTFQTRLEDDVRAVFKVLGYPYQISKSALHAVGSPHTWPALLGALTWLLELLNYDEAAEQKQNEREALDPESSGNKAFFSYLEKTYHSFLGGDDNFDDLDQELAESFELKNQSVKDEIEGLEDEKLRLERRVQEIRASESPLETVRARSEDLKTNVDKFKKLIDELEQYSTKMGARAQEKQTEVSNKEQELATCVAKLERLKGTIAQQESDAVDVQRIERDRATLKTAMGRLAEQREHAERQHMDTENAVVSATQDVETALARYHELADALRLIPASAENASGVNFATSLTRNASATRSEDLLSVDLKGVVRPALHELKEVFLNMVYETQSEALNLHERSDVLEEKVMIKKDEISVLDAKLNKLETQYKTEKESLSEQMRANAEQSRRMEEEVSGLKSDYEEKLRASQRRAATASAELREDRERLVHLRNEASRNMLAAIDRLTTHKAHIESSLSALQNHLETITLEP